jgi:hypothetical protein
MGVKPEDIERAIAGGNKILAQLKKTCPSPAELAAGISSPVSHPGMTIPAAHEPRRIRQDTKPLLNKLETEFLNRVKDLYPNYPPVRAQSKTFRLCNGVRFTPDLSCSIWPVDGGPARETCWEIKGPKSWDDAIVKAKMAAHEFPEICWRFVWKEKGKWLEQILLP